MKARFSLLIVGLTAAFAGHAIETLGTSRGMITVAAITLEQAARTIQSTQGGRILAAHTERKEGREVHVIKTLTPDGRRVRYFRVDSASGRIGGGARKKQR